MAKSTPKTPAPPDPNVTSAAQTQSNKETALYNFGLDNPTVNTPLGSSAFTLNTSNPNAPQATQVITLSPEQQQLYNQQTQQSVGLSNIANQLMGGVGNAISQPLPSYSNLQDASKKASDAYLASQMAYLQPQQQVQKEQLDSQLANQGVMPGSEAYNTAQDAMARQNTFANMQAQNNAIMYGPQNAQQLFGLDVAAQNQPLNELNALRSGSQVQMPSFGSANPVSMQGTNVAGIAQQGYQNSINGYNQQVASQNANTQGLFGIGASAAGAMPWATWLSDARLKENIQYVGQEHGFPIYHFNYIADPVKSRYRGVMAQQVATVRPDAIVMDGDYMAVDYGKLGIEFGRVQ